MTIRTKKRSFILLSAIAVLAGVLAGLKYFSVQAEILKSQRFEPTEMITFAVAKEHLYRRTTTAIGTVVALRSVMLRNELSGTVRSVSLPPGEIVEEGTVLIALDVAVEEAELRAQRARAVLAETVLERTRRASRDLAAAAVEVDRARAEYEVALAEMARTQAVIDRKTIRAPFRARVGISDVHVGQYLEQGTLLTTLQGVDNSVHIDFSVPQRVVGTLRPGSLVEVFPGSDNESVLAKVIAVDSRVDPATRNANVRALVENITNFPPPGFPPPGASVRVQVPVGAPEKSIVIPVSALRKGPNGDHVFVIITDQQGNDRAQLRVVESGAFLGDEVVIYSGLQAGERVAASGSFKLRDGVIVADANAGVAQISAP